MVMSWTARALLDTVITDITTLHSFVKFLYKQLINRYLNSGMAAQVEVKFSWMTDFGVYNCTCNINGKVF
jgi:hypothetical protein